MLFKGQQTLQGLDVSRTNTNVRAHMFVFPIAIVEQNMASHESKKSLVNTDNSLLRSQCINATLADPSS